MPRRKRTTAQNEGQRKCRRADNKEEDTLVISDSDNEEEEEAGSKVTSREARWQDRDTRAQMQDMTEEEMLDLAMRLSKQEANSAAQRQQLEDDDMQKAIAESLHVSQRQAWEENSETASSVAKQSQDPSTVKARMRRKLYFPSKREAERAMDEDDTAAAESGEDSMQDSKSLLPMPDLSQKTLSQSPPPSPSLLSVPSTSTQKHQSPQLKSSNEQVLRVPNEQDSPEDVLSQGSETQCSAAFLKQCFVRVEKNLTSSGRTSDNSPTTQNISLSLTCPDRSQLTQKQSPSPVKSPVFAKMDPKESAALSADKGALCISKKMFTDKVCTPKKEEEEEDETCKDSSSHKKQVNDSREHQKRLSLCRKAQPSSCSLVPDEEEDDIGAKQETVHPEQLKDGSSRRTSFSAELEKVPNSEDMPLHADSKSLEEFTSHMVLHLSDDDDEEDEEEEKIAVPSPVFHQECVPHAGSSKLSPTQHCISPPTASTSPLCSRAQDSDLQNICIRKKCTSKTAYPAESIQQERGDQKKSACDSRSTHVMDEKSGGFVSYYWGVPFCPRGQNPDDYTRVILSQLEVYEKSLKEAQHQLLHKAEWGLPLFPCRAERPFIRRMKRHRAPQLLEEEEEEPEKEENEQNKADEEDEDGEERADFCAASGEAAENKQNETYVVVSSPETQIEIVENSPLPFRQHEDSDAAKLPSCRKSSSHDPSEDTQIEQPDEHNKTQDENYDVESTMCPETQMSEDNTPELMVTSPVQPQLQEETEVMEVDEEAAEDERMEQEQAEEEQQQQREPVPPQNQRVECPMCTRFFPISKIEVHAAYCDGTTEEAEQEEEPSQVPTLRSRNRQPEMGVTSPKSTENKSEQRHKCYLCQRFFTSEEMYSRHVDKCLKQKQSKSNQGNGLLSALHKAECVDDDDSEAGPSDTMIKNHGVPAESSEVAESGGDEDGSTSAFYVSSSPIKSFTPISEATDCLIDFQNQYSDRTSRRLGRKRKLKLFKMA
ncbi:BRCA1-A complex subunit RAP80 isoform X1 [Astyanax mexicanus]|uniref:BRCA1-A complex subunit RAP80 isoform X1 n=1 Tax=Astyanax mexicanus TaxID=7994 RepID=UPI0020CACC2F|nr:BRCA1-A complex subunit RAP80 isoform X1 [Astyanax mexicanus]